MRAVPELNRILLSYIISIFVYTDLKKNFNILIAEESYKTKKGRLVTPEVVAVQDYPKVVLVFEGKTGIIRNTDQIKRELDIDPQQFSLPLDTPVELILYCQPGNQDEIRKIYQECQNFGNIILWLVDIPRKKVIKIGGDEHNDRKFDIAINRGFPIPDNPPIELVPLLLSDSVTTTAGKIFEALGRDAIIKGFEGKNELLFDESFIKESIGINISSRKMKKSIEMGIELNLCEKIDNNNGESKYKLNMNPLNRNSQGAYFNRLKNIRLIQNQREKQPEKSLWEFF